MSERVTFLLIIALFCFNLFAVEKAIVRINNPSQETIHHYYQSGYDIAAIFPGRWLDLVVAETEIESLRLIHPNLLITQTEAELKANLLSLDRDLVGYRSYAQLTAELNTLAAEHSDIMTLSTIGTGWGAQYLQEGYTNYTEFNHDIIAVKISSNPSIEEDEPAVFFVGGHHAREPLGVEATMSVLNDLLDNYNIDPWVTNIVNTTAIWFVPMVNPDGHHVVWDQIDIWWRKNIRDNNNNHTFSTDNNYGYGNDGVDLNRNYDFGWGYQSTSDAIYDILYHGPNPFSEPETQAIRDMLTVHPFLAGLSYHTYGQLILYPYGYISNIIAPDVQELFALASEMAELIPSEQGGTYTPEAGWLLYPASGGLDDWAYGEHGIFSFTVELSTTYIPNASTAVLVAENIKPSARKLLERTTKSMLTGHVTDAVTRNPIEATIHVEGIDNSPVNRAPYTSKLPYGRYYRLLPAGNWNIRILAEGYLPFEAQVSISDTSVTNLDIDLFAAGQGSLTVLIQTFGEIPVENARLEFLNTEIEPLYSDAAGMINIPEFNYGYYEIMITKPGFETIHSNYTITEPNLSILFSNFPYIEYDFEQNLAGWTVGQGWGLSTLNYYSGEKSLSDSPSSNYSSNVDSYARLNEPLNLTNFANVNLSYMVKSNIWQDGDYCALEFSLNGEMWNTIDFYDGVFDWTQKSYNLNGLIGQQVYLRFHMSTNEYQNTDGIFIDDLKIFGSGVVENTDETQISASMSLTIFPNPMRKVTNLQINVNLEKPVQTEVCIYNIKGQKVNQLLNNILTKGVHSVIWNGCNSQGISAGNGIYFAIVSVNGKKITARKIMLLK